MIAKKSKLQSIMSSHYNFLFPQNENNTLKHLLSAGIGIKLRKSEVYYEGQHGIRFPSLFRNAPKVSKYFGHVNESYFIVCHCR